MIVYVHSVQMRKCHLWWLDEINFTWMSEKQ